MKSDNFLCEGDELVEVFGFLVAIIRKGEIKGDLL